MMGSKRIYTQFLRETYANIKYVENREGDSQNYVIAVPGRSTAISRDKRDRLCVSHLAARAVVVKTKEMAQQILDYYLKQRCDRSLKIISESEYYESTFRRAMTIIRDFTDFALEEE